MTVPARPSYRLGCPIWACPTWRGQLYPQAARPQDFLTHYAQVFACVEGNSTFYALPSADTVDKWRAATPDGFHFCFKFPREVTHDRLLRSAEAPTHRFLSLMARLPNRLGPLLLQLPPGFGPRQLPDLDRFLQSLPREFKYAVEVRHPALFGAHEDELSAVLIAHGVSRGLMDTRAVHASPPTDATTVRSQGRKPKVPWRTIAHANRPFVRVVGQNDVRATTGYLDQWAEVVAGWLADGMAPYVFLHAPDDDYAPRLARAFHYLLRKRRPDLPEHPPWPGDQPATPQLGLFG